MSRLVVLALVPLLVVAWPVLHVAVYRARFGRLPEGGLRAGLVFLPMSLVAGVALVALLLWRPTPPQRRGVVLGYLVAAPVAFIGSLLGPLVLPVLAGTLVGGALPLLVGMALGLRASRGTTAGDARR